MKKFLSTVIAFLLIITATPINAYAVSTDTLKNKVVSVAQAEVGYEGTSTYSKYGEWYGYQGGWCTTFALWCFYTAGEALGVKLYSNIVPSGGNCNSMISWYKNKGRYHERTSGYTPSKGDLVFFDWSGNGSSQHVGIVTGTSGSTIYTVEGNCSGKVKSKTYTTTGSKPYGNVSSIMGYGNPNWSAVGKGSSGATTTKKVTTTAKPTTTTAKAKTKKKKKAAATTATTTQPTTAAKKKKHKKKKKVTTTKAPVLAREMEIHAATTELEIGDSVELNYTVKPQGASAVVGYFCDEENIIEISDGGVITATGEGTATVVVCANDEIYRQCDFVVTENSAQVTVHSPEDINNIQNTDAGKKTRLQRLAEIGINAEKLISHKRNFLIPVAIVGVTALLSLAILGVKAIASAIRKKKGEPLQDDE